MGGTVLGAQADRMSKEVYKELSGLLLDEFQDLDSGCNFKVIETYKNKTSFGDMDIIYNKSYITQDCITDK